MTRQVNFKKLMMEYLLLAGIATLVIITAIVEPKFLTGENLGNIIKQFGPLSLAALGMTYVIVGGFIDLSVGGIISLISVIMVMLIDRVGQVGSLLVVLALGMLLGAINGGLCLTSGAMTEPEALYITYGVGAVFTAVALLVTGGTTQHMSLLNSSYSLFQVIGNGSFGIISVSFLIFLFFLVALYIFHRKTSIGRSISYTGGNKVAAELAGLPVKKCVMLIYVVSGLMAAVAAVVLTSRVTSAIPQQGKGYETNAIMSVVVGGTSMQGGNGHVLRTVLGVLLITLMSNCLNLLSVSAYMQVVVKGLILVIAIWLDNRKNQ